MSATYGYFSNVSATTVNGNPLLSGSGSSGRTAFWTGTSTLSGRDDFYWDDVNRRLSVGGNTAPVATVQVSGSFIVSTSAQTTTPSLYVSSTGVIGIGTSSPNTSGLLDVAGGVNATSLNINAFGTLARSGGNLNINSTGGAYGVVIYPGSGGAAALVVKNGTGNVGISNSSPIAKLDVNGTISASDVIQVGQSTLSCATQISGSIRYNITSDTLQVCTASGWKSLTSGTAAMPTGTGTANYVARWTGANTLGTGVLRDDGSYVGIGVTPKTATATLQAGDIAMYGSANLLGFNAYYNSGYKAYSGSLYGGAIRMDGSAGKLQFLTSTNAPAADAALTLNNAMTIDSSQRIGIGTTSPNAKLDVSGVVSATNHYANDGDTAAAPGYAWATDQNTGMFHPAADSVGWSINGTERLRLTTTGLGIGTTNPTYQLDVQSTSTVTSGGRNYVVRNYLNVAPATQSTAYNTLMWNRCDVTAAGLISGSDVLCVYNQVAVNRTGDISTTYASYNSIVNSNTGDITTALGNMGVVQNTGAGVIGSSVGVHGESNNTAGGAMTYGIGIRGISYNGGTGNVTTMHGAKAYSYLYNTGDASAAYGGEFFVQTVNAGAAVTNAYGVVGGVYKDAGAITNAYGLYLTDIEGTNQYGVYQVGADDKNYFGGSVGIGTIPTRDLQIAGHQLFSGATSNTISWGSTGVAAPGAGSAGMKLQLYGLSKNAMSTADYAIGIESGNMWFNVGGGYKWYNNAGATPDMLLDSSGRLGIATASPDTASMLDVNGTATVRGAIVIGGANTASDGQLEIISDNDLASYIDFKGNGSEATDYKGRLSYTDRNGFGFFVNGGATGVMYISDSGNVGIGTSAPASKLEVYDAVNSTVISKVTNNSTGTAAQARLDLATGVANAYGILGVNNNSGSPYMILSTGAGVTVGTYYDSAAHIFRSSAGAEYMRATSTGLGVGLGANPTYRVELPNTASTAGQGRANAWVTYSDGRFKTEVKTIEHALDKVMGLRGVTYFSATEKQPRQQIGFIAQEVQKTIPQVVSVARTTVAYEGTSKTQVVDDYRSLDYARLVPVLTEAIKELKADNDNHISRTVMLETELKAANDNVIHLQERLEALERRLAQ